MSGEVAVIEEKDLTVVRTPEIVLSEAQRAARALADVVSKKKKPVIMNGEQYLEFEDWQTVGKFYDVTAYVVSTKPIEIGDAKGFEARATAVKNGVEISAADAMCMNDEPNWKHKPSFQLRSMAQTRACAKALRNVLAWVVVLAGYRATPAEEIQDMATTVPPQAKPEPKPEPKKSEPSDEATLETTIDSVEEKTGKSGKVYFDIHAAGEKFSTFDKEIAEYAAQAVNSNVVVEIRFITKQQGKYSYKNVVGIE